MKPRIKVSSDNILRVKDTLDAVNKYKLHTVCQEAKCPNLQECWSKGHATFLILGDICTRACKFCSIKTGKPYSLDKSEPLKVANSVLNMKLKHVVITSVNRDDLIDGGAFIFAQTIYLIRKLSPESTIEILTPDFRDKKDAIDIILGSPPDVFNHNLETVPRLYNKIRKGARYDRSLDLLKKIKKRSPSIFTKSGIMVGLGETLEEISQVMDDMRSSGIDFLTIGQYLQPTSKHAPVERFVSEHEFSEYKKMAQEKGFLMVSSSPLTRSSYHAGDDFKKLKAART